MSIYLTFILILSSLFATDPANSDAVQEALNSVEETEAVPYPVERLEEKWSAKLASKGKGIGVLNDDGSIYVIGSEVAMGTPGTPGFTESRKNAYGNAELTAKMEIVRMMNETMTSGRSSSVFEDIITGEDPDAKEKASKLDKASKIVDKSLDKALSFLGVSDSEINDMNEDKKKATFQQTFNSYSRSLAAAAVKGCGVVATSEGKAGNSGYQMAVLMKYAPELRKLSAIFSSGKIMPVPSGKAKNSLDKLNSIPAEKLISNHGSRLMYDKDGAPMVVGFGQRSYETGGRREASKVSAAHSKAAMDAKTAIKNFVAEDMTVDEMVESAEKLTEYDDGQENYFSQEKWSRSIKSKETTLNMDGIMTLRKWRAKHPLTNEHIAGVIVYWSMENRKTAKGMKKDSEFDQTDDLIENKKKTKIDPTKDGYMDDSDNFFDDDDDF